MKEWIIGFNAFDWTIWRRKKFMYAIAASMSSGVYPDDESQGKINWSDMENICL